MKKVLFPLLRDQQHVASLSVVPSKVGFSTNRKPRRYSDLAAAVVLKDAPSNVVPSGRELQQLEFNKLFPDIIRHLASTDGQHYEVDSAKKYLARMLQYNMTGGSKARGLAVVQSYRILAAPEDLIPRNLRLSHIMGWCLEMLHTSLLMTQDVIDQSEVRRGKPCWYLQTSRQRPDEAPRLLETGIYKLLKKHFKETPYYVNCLELFHDVSGKAMLGQVLDMETRSDPTLATFTMDRYTAITKYKSAFYSFMLPVSLAMQMAGIQDPEMHRQARTILLEMGQFYQVQVDYYNCYGLPDTGQSDGKDIQDGKCSWLAVVALQRATPEQKKVLLDCYGSKEPEKVAQVRQLYNDLGLPSTFKRYEDHNNDLLCTQIQQLSRGLPHKLFFNFLKNMCGPNVNTHRK